MTGLVGMLVSDIPHLMFFFVGGYNIWIVDDSRISIFGNSKPLR